MPPLDTYLCPKIPPARPDDDDYGDNDNIDYDDENDGNDVGGPCHGKPLQPPTHNQLFHKI